MYTRQTKILKRQRELFESEQKALPRILSYDLISHPLLLAYEEKGITIPDSPTHPERYAQFMAQISNAGKGFAENMWIELIIQSPNYIFSLPFPLGARTNYDQLLSGDPEGGVLAPEDNEVRTFTAEIFLNEEDLPENVELPGISLNGHLTPSELLWVLSDVGESPVEIGLFLHYSDGTGVKEPIQLLTTKSELEGFPEFNETWRSGGKPSGNMKPMFSLD